MCSQLPQHRYPWVEDAAVMVAASDTLIVLTAVGGVLLVVLSTVLLFC